MSIKSIFLGRSMICVIISNLPEDMTYHPPPKDLFDDSYQPCEADETIREILEGISIPVTQITHEPTFQIVIPHHIRYKIDKDDFEETITKISDKFGFLNYMKPFYNKDCQDSESEMSGIIGEMYIGLIGKSSCVACANLISKQLLSITGFIDNIGMTMTMTAMSSIQNLNFLNPSLGKIPTINPLSNVIRIPPCEIEAMKDLLKQNKKWKFNENYRILIIPSEEEFTKKLSQIRKDDNIACFLACGMDEPDLIPQCIYATQKDGTVKTYGVCRECATALLANYDDIKTLYDPVTHLIDQESIKDIKKPIKGLGLIEQEKDKKGNFWPQIPIGQIIWSLMSDKSDELKSYVKAWFTIVVEYAIQISDLFTFCPNHKDILIPKSNQTLRCKLCDMIYCMDCHSWHKMGEKCFEGLPGVKRCPKCHCPGEKYTGCDHITCPKCNFEWNYRTEKAYNDSEYEFD